MTIGERIKQRREELQMSQGELAAKIGYKSRSSVNKIELGIYNLTQSKIKAIADALDTTPAFIMGWDEKTDQTEQKRNQACELFEQCYGKEAYQAVSAFLKLDAADRQNITRMISVMLEDEKYSAQEGLKHA